MGWELVLEAVRQHQNTQNTKRNLINQNESLALSNEELRSRRNSYETALAGWQNAYEASINSQKQSAQNQLTNMRNAWGMTNATLADRNTSGKTAQLLSNQQKQNIIAYAGNDMKLNFNDAEIGVADAFSSDISKLSALGNNAQYGIYERELIDTMSSLRMNKQTMQEDIAIINDSINQNRNTIRSNRNFVNNNTGNFLQDFWGAFSDQMHDVGEAIGDFFSWLF